MSQLAIARTDRYSLQLLILGNWFFVIQIGTFSNKFVPMFAHIQVIVGDIKYEDNRYGRD